MDGCERFWDFLKCVTFSFDSWSIIGMLGGVAPVIRGGSGWLDSLFLFLSGASRAADYAAVRLSEYTRVRRLAVKRLMRSGLVVER